MPAWVLSVGLPLPLWKSLDYLVPETFTPESPALGCRVIVPLGQREVVGCIVNVIPLADTEHSSELRTAIRILDDEPLFLEKDMKLLFWASEYYHHPLGQVIEGALPVWMRKGRDASALPALKSEDHCISSPGYTLNKDQLASLQAIQPTLEHFCVWLLEGVTGSGKTEVYLQLAAMMLAHGKQVLFLVPEISLTPQLEAKIRTRFPDCVAIQHSGVSEKKKAIAWKAAHDGKARMIVGTRSAVWTPMPQLGLVIIDEEHDSSFKQQEGFRYSARDVAIMRSRLLDIPVLMGSATPSLESLCNVARGRYHHSLLPRRTGQSRPPVYTVIDLRQYRPGTGGMTAPLVDAIQKTLEIGQQVLLFINRRGYAPVLICDECGWIMECPHCDSPQVMHAAKTRMCCHHCGHENPIPLKCGACKSTGLHTLGTGTEKVEKLLEERFPDIPIYRIDRDNTRRKGQLDEMLGRIAGRQRCIMIGTQMLAKGHHLPDVTLVGILDMDGGFFSVDFRALERMAQTMVQVAGRAGRGHNPGKVIIQTRHPRHPLLLQLINQGYAAFASSELALRSQAGLPPWTHQILWRCDAKSEEDATAWLLKLKEAGEPLSSHIAWWGPAPSPLPRMANRFRMQLLIQSEARSYLHQCAHTLISLLLTWPETRKVRWSLDVDPTELR